MEEGEPETTEETAEEAEEESEVEVEFDLDWEDFHGLEIHTPDVDMHLGGRFALDLIKYGHANERSSGLELDDARLILDGSTGSFRWWVEPDLVGVDTPRNLYEMWGAWDIDPLLRLTGGQLRVAFSSEFATREEDLPFAGYAFPSYLDGRYDVGLRADGDLLPDGLWYEATATAGKGFNLEGNRIQSPLYALRLVTHPFAAWSPEEPGILKHFNGFFLGAAYSHLRDFDDPIILTTPYESTVFRTPDLDGDSGRWLHYEVGYHNGPFRFAWERVTGEAQDVPIGAGLEEDMDQLTSWALYGTWNITGEEQNWERGRWVKSTTAKGSWKDWIDIPGRWELGARYSNADIDRGLFDYGITNYMISTQEVRTFSLELGWFPTPFSRLSLGWVKTIADHELITFGNTNRDSSFLLRLETYF